MLCLVTKQQQTACLHLQPVGQGFCSVQSSSSSSPRGCALLPITLCWSTDAPSCTFQALLHPATAGGTAWILPDALCCGHLMLETTPLILRPFVFNAGGRWGLCPAQGEVPGGNSSCHTSPGLWWPQCLELTPAQAFWPSWTFPLSLLCSSLP